MERRAVTDGTKVQRKNLNNGLGVKEALISIRLGYRNKAKESQIGK